MTEMTRAARMVVVDHLPASPSCRRHRDRRGRRHRRRRGMDPRCVDGTDLAAIVAAAGGSPRSAGVARRHRTRAGCGRGHGRLVVQSGQPVALRPGSRRPTAIEPWASALLGRDPTSPGVRALPDDDQTGGRCSAARRPGPAAARSRSTTSRSPRCWPPSPARPCAEGAGAASRVASPAQLGPDLGRLAEADPARYAADRPGRRRRSWPRADRGHAARERVRRATPEAACRRVVPRLDGCCASITPRPSPT